MQVIDHLPHGWFLLQDGDDLYLDVNCSIHAVGYTVLIRLDEHERDRFSREGRTYVEDLAARISHDGPPVDERSDYRARDLTTTRGSEVMRAVTRWREESG